MTNQLFETLEDLEKELGAGVRQVRIQHHLTQTELATKANISRSAVKYLEAGRGSSLSTLVRVARALGRSDWLTSFAPAQPTYSPLAALRAQQKRTDVGRVRRTTRSK